MAFFKKREIEEVKKEEIPSDPLLQALLSDKEITRTKAMNIPDISACVNKIGDTISALDIKLYRKDGDKVEEVIGDNRTYLLNHETGDTLDSAQFKKALITDMYLGQGGYAFVNKVGSEVKSLHYVDERNVSFVVNEDPIFKDYKILVNGKSYEGFQFIKLLRNTEKGYKGKSIIEESQTLLSIVYSSQIFEKNLVKTGGNKKGFIQSTTRLSKDAMTALKTAFKNLYSNNSENVVVLNDGLSFKESSNTSVELQLNENKKTNGADICKIFLIPPSIINGGSTDEDKKQYIEGCIIPILNRLEKAINSVLLSEDEKDSYFFSFDTSDLLKGDIEKRFTAYKTALDAGFMQLDEVRKNEKLPEFGLDFIKLGLQDVLYFPEKDEIYTPNTNKLSKINDESEKLTELDDDSQDSDENQENIDEEDQTDPEDLDDIKNEKGEEISEDRD